MTDIRSLLREAAGPAPRPVDLRVVAARAARRRPWRRALIWVSALGAVVGVGIPVETALAPAGHGRVDVATVHPPDQGEQQRVVAAMTRRSIPAPAKPASQAARPAVQAPSAVARRAAPGAAGAASSPRPTPTTTSPAARYATAYGCSLDSVGLMPGKSRQCQFTAITAGGWLFDNSAGDAGIDTPQAAITVSHSGTTEIYTSHHLTDCADAIISPGDQVLVTLTAPTMDVTVTYRTGAGRAWGCSTPTTSGAPA